MQRETKTVSSWTRCKTDKSEIFKHHLWSLIRWISYTTASHRAWPRERWMKGLRAAEKNDLLISFFVFGSVLRGNFRADGSHFDGTASKRWRGKARWFNFLETKARGREEKKIGCWADTSESCLMLTRICPVASYRSHQTTHMNTFSLPSPLTSRMS